MKKNLLLTLFGFMLICCSSGGDNNNNDGGSGGNDNAKEDLTITQSVVIESFVGNGAQWGGYDILQSWTGSPTLSQSDWDKLYTRIRFMRPGLMRVMVSAGWNYMKGTEFDPSKSNDVLFKILDFCQAEGISVMLGEWGHSGGTSIDQKWLDNSAKFVEYLIGAKNYTCIKYFNMVNEPNGNWSSINGNYSLWADLIDQFHTKLVANGTASKIKIIGPDIAIWDANSTAWVSNAHNDLGDKMGAYDIHTYPNETVVRSNSYANIIGAYKFAAPRNKDMIMGELGFKYTAGTALKMENDRRIAADKYTSEDSNMFIFDGFYGIDVADAMIQCMAAGYTSTQLWMMDDAMYNIDGGVSTELKRWGFWNILGSEKFENSADENIRPWFYTASLLCRFFPTGSKIYQVTLPDKIGVRAIAAEKSGKYTIAIVNSHMVDYPNINIKMEHGTTLAGAKHYQYISGTGNKFTGEVDANGFAKEFKSGDLNLSNNKSFSIALPAQSFYMITNIE